MIFQKPFVKEKLDEIYKYLEEAKIVFKSSNKEISGDFIKYHTAERIFQLIVDLILDVNHHFIKELNFKVSEDLQGTFHILGENKILPKDFTTRVAPTVGLRNRIVHQYESLDKELFIKTFRKNYPDFKIYIKLINQYLKKIK